MNKVQEQIESLRTVQKCVYLAAEAEPAKDISDRCKKAADTLEYMQARIELLEKVACDWLEFWECGYQEPQNNLEERTEKLLAALKEQEEDDICTYCNGPRRDCDPFSCRE